MIISYAVACALLLIVSFAREPAMAAKNFKRCLPYGVAAGLLNAANNLLRLAANRHVAQSIKLPFSTGSSLAIGFLIGFLLYKERFTKRQILGLVLGVLAVGLLLARNFLG